MFETNLFFKAAKNTELNTTSRKLECNKTALNLEMEECGGRFKIEMAELDPQDWCNLTHFIR